MTEPITKKRAFHAGFLHQIGRGFIDLFRGNSRPNQVAHTIEDVAGGAT